MSSLVQTTSMPPLLMLVHLYDVYAYIIHGEEGFISLIPINHEYNKCGVISIKVYKYISWIVYAFKAVPNAFHRCLYTLRLV